MWGSPVGRLLGNIFIDNMRDASFHAEALRRDLTRLSRTAADVLPVADVSFAPHAQAENREMFVEQARESLALLSPGMAKAAAMAALEADTPRPRAWSEEELEQRTPHALVLPVLATAHLLDAIRNQSTDELEQALLQYEQAIPQLTEAERRELDAFLAQHADVL